MKTWLKRNSIALTVILLLAAIILGISKAGESEPPEPSECALCGSFPYHAPCIVNLSTGEIGEITIYQPHYTKVAELAEEQPGGYFCYMSCAGLRGYCIGAEYATLYVPKDVERLQPEHFCNSCRELLKPYRKSGFVVADLRVPEQPAVYALEEGNTFSFRCYDVEILHNEESDALEVVVTGLLKPET